MCIKNTQQFWIQFCIMFSSEIEEEGVIFKNIFHITYMLLVSWKVWNYQLKVYLHLTTDL